MNREEQITLEYLKSLLGEDVVPVPKHKDPPDILVGSTIAVEVRRLNQHFFEGGKPEGLENLSYPLDDAFEEVLKSFNHLYTGKSYWVFVDYRRPLKSEIRQAKKDMRLALQKFLDSRISKFPCEISVNSEFTFSIYKSDPGNGKLFPVAGSGDFDAGGGVIGVYAENIRHCINEKSS
ncbi:MAG: hypothetical protein HY868_10805 [Chloroflexi bacterium]|nr:hypothetical protein [Chloroflexota bacterium]